jgi:flagellar biosynthesis protein FlhF
MKLRTFNAPDMPTAMRQIREALGEDAVILATTPERGKKGVRVTAASERSEERSTFDDFKDTIELAKRRTQNLDWQLELRSCLTFHRTPENTINRILKTSDAVDIEALLTLQKLAAETSKHSITEKVCTQVLERHFRFSPLPLTEGGRRFMFIGHEGAGKTLLTAKCATSLTMRGHPVSIITTDHKRAGGIDQLAAFTDILKLPLHVAHSPEELGQILHSLPIHHTVFIDSSGFNAYDAAQKKALQQLAAKPDIEPILILHAGMDAEESAYLARESALLAPKRIILTHLDTARRYGSLLASADIASLAIAGFTGSSRVVDTLTPMTADMLAARLLEYRLHSHTNRGQ